MYALTNICINAGVPMFARACLLLARRSGYICAHVSASMQTIVHCSRMCVARMSISVYMPRSHSRMRVLITCARQCVLRVGARLIECTYVYGCTCVLLLRARRSRSSSTKHMCSLRSSPWSRRAMTAHSSASRRSL